jgi:hypothetical protein
VSGPGEISDVCDTSSRLPLLPRLGWTSGGSRWQGQVPKSGQCCPYALYRAASRVRPLASWCPLPSAPCQGWKRPKMSAHCPVVQTRKQTRKGKGFIKLLNALLQNSSLIPRACGKPQTFLCPGACWPSGFLPVTSQPVCGPVLVTN